MLPFFLVACGDDQPKSKGLEIVVKFANPDADSVAISEKEENGDYYDLLGRKKLTR